MAVFALTIPVFSNLFYDKLVPSASVSSLFGVAIIVAVFIVFEFILRTSKDIYQSITARQDDVDIDIAFLEAVLYSKKEKMADPCHQHLCYGMNFRKSNPFY
ncbi:hypothetical protein I5080_22675 [Salmonella enterica]|nr:hypothetical protein I5080_22675 [Salmonella enterica]